MKVSYLVIWQLGDNEQSREETPVDVTYVNHVEYTAQEKYNKIIEKIKKNHDNMTVVGIFKL